MSTEQSGCSCACDCNSVLNIIFSCSGAADVGELADRAARKLSRDGVGKMSCLAGIGGNVSGIVKSAEAATSILAIDGCPLECAKKSLEAAGIARFNYLKLSDLNFEKGSTDVTEETVDKVVNLAKNFF